MQAQCILLKILSQTKAIILKPHQIDRHHPGPFQPITMQVNIYYLQFLKEKKVVLRPKQNVLGKN